MLLVHTNEKTWHERDKCVARCIVYLKTCQGLLAGFAFTSKNMPKEVGRFPLTS